MEKKKVYITNFTRLESYDGGSKVRITTDAEGNETGFEVRGTLTTFDVRNENGGIFRKDSYDKFVDEYFIANSLNVPVCLYHNDTDIRNVCGKVKEMTKTDNGVDIVAWIPRRAYYYNLIKAQIEDGILQGFSNAGGVTDGEYDPETDTLNITQFALLHAALVATPADTGATLKTENTVFKGFAHDVEVENETKKEDNSDQRTDAPVERWRTLV